MYLDALTGGHSEAGLLEAAARHRLDQARVIQLLVVVIITITIIITLINIVIIISSSSIVTTIVSLITTIDLWF